MSKFDQLRLPKVTAGTAPTIVSREPDKKYTVLLSQALQEMIDEDVKRLRKASGLNVTRSDVVRSLIRQLHQDESLYDTVLRDLVARADG